MIRLATAFDKDAVRDLWHACFHDTKEYMDLWFSEFFPRAKTLVFAEDGRIKGALQMLPVTLISKGAEYSGYYIGGVSVWEEFRHEKIGSRLMEEAKETAVADGMDFCILVSDVVGYYQRFGYETLSHRSTFSAKPVEPHPFTFLPMQEGDGERVLALYQRFTNEKPAYQVRTAKQMRDMLRLEKSSNGGVTLIQKGDELLGYVAYDAWEDTLFVDEALWVSEEGKNGVLAFLHNFGKSTISIRCGEEFGGELGNPSVMIQKIKDISLPGDGCYYIAI